MKENDIKKEKDKIKLNEVGFITKASAQYCDKFPIRAVIQAIPGLGSSLDTMLAGLGAKWQYERLEDFVSKLNEKLSLLEQSGKLENIEPSEAWFDFMMQNFDRVIKTRSEDKRMRFANLVAKQVTNQREWDKAETASRLIGELSDIHIKILDIALKAPVYKDVGGRGVITVEEKSIVPPFFKDKVVYLEDKFHNMPNMYLMMMCVELLSRNLLTEEGIHHTDSIGMAFYSATYLAEWLMDWISETGSPKNGS